MAIQMRRGQKADFDPAKMLPGEWAVSIDSDTNNQIVWMCFRAGVVKRMGTYEDFRAQIEEATEEVKAEYLAEFNTILDEVERLAEQTKTNTDTVIEIKDTVMNTYLPQMLECKESAAQSAAAAKNSETNAKGSETNAESSASTATAKATEAASSATMAGTRAASASNSSASARNSATEAASSASTATEQAVLAESYSIGGTNSRTGEDTDNAEYYKNQASVYAARASSSEATIAGKVGEVIAQASAAARSATTAAEQAVLAENYAAGPTDSAKYYYEQAKTISESFSGALRPMGTVAFANLPSISSAVEGDMYNIANEFTTTAAFKEGAGLIEPAGSNVYKTADGYWDILAGTPVTGVKGNAESTYRKGNVNLTPANIGALPASHANLMATDATLGHVKLSNVYDSRVGAAVNGIGASQASVFELYEKITRLFKLQDANNRGWAKCSNGSNTWSDYGGNTYYTYIPNVVAGHKYLVKFSDGVICEATGYLYSSGAASVRYPEWYTRTKKTPNAAEVKTPTGGSGFTETGGAYILSAAKSAIICMSTVNSNLVSWYYDLTANMLLNI